MTRAKQTAANLGRRRSSTAPSLPSGAGAPFDREQLQHIIEGLTDGVILVEADQRIAWANEAALVLHGVRTLAELGATIDDYRNRFELRDRNRHHLPDGEHPLERLIGGDSFSEVVVDVGLLGEKSRWTHQIRSLVLTGTDGVPSCLVLLINNVTQQFEAEDRFESMFNANPAPAVICTLAELRFCRINQGFCDLTGFGESDLIGRSLHQVDLLAKADRRDLALERLHTGRTIPQMEAWLPCQDGGERLVLMAGQPIEVSDKPCMLFTFADLQRRHEAHQALAHSERRFSAAFRLAPAPMLILSTTEHQIVDANDSFLRVSGYVLAELHGRKEREIDLWGDEVSATIVEAGHSALPIRGLDIGLRRKDRTSRSHLLSAEAVVMNDEPHVLVIMQDIAERKRTESQLIEAIEQVLSDTSWFGQKVMEKLAELPGRVDRDGDGRNAIALSKREEEIAGLLGRGLSDRQVAAQLKVTLSTARNHVSAIYRKIGVHRRAEAVVWARERGFSAKKSR
jgi:PAS domain S-box-containing protein